MLASKQGKPLNDLLEDLPLLRNRLLGFGRPYREVDVVEQCVQMRTGLSPQAFLVVGVGLTPTSKQLHPSLEKGVQEKQEVPRVRMRLWLPEVLADGVDEAGVVENVGPDVGAYDGHQ